MNVCGICPIATLNPHDYASPRRVAANLRQTTERSLPSTAPGALARVRGFSGSDVIRPSRLRL